MDLCSICEKSEADSREHVWPSWYLRHLDQIAPPPYGWALNGVPVSNRSGEPVRSQRRQRVLLPVCEGCNGSLDLFVEKPAKDVIRDLVTNRWAGSVERSEWQALGVWFAKVLLLLGHPRSRHEHPAIDRVAVRFDGRPPDYTWLVDGSAPPKELSLWVHNCDMDDETTKYRVPLPNVVISEGQEVNFEVMVLGMEGLCVTMVWHPGWQIVHPLESQGLAWELLHSPPTRGDLSSLSRMGAKSVAWTPFRPTLKEGFVLDWTLPPLAATESWPAAPEVLGILEQCSF